MPLYPQEPLIESTTIADAGGVNVASVDAAGDVQVDINNFPATQAVTQSGVWTVQPGNTVNTTPWLVENRTGTVPTYSAAITNLIAATTPTDVFTITGSGTKTVHVTYIEFTATETTSAVRDVVLIKRSSANSGGTSSAVTAVSNDSTNSAATATVLAYTANPTLGTTVGTVRSRNIDFESTNLVGSSDFVVWTFGDKTQPIVLRGTGEVLAINLGGVTAAGNSIDIAIEWTEQ